MDEILQASAVKQMLQLKVLQPKLFLTVLTWLPLLFHALSEYWLGRQEVKGVGDGREEVISGFHFFYGIPVL